MPGLSNGWEWLHFALLPKISPEMSPLEQSLPPTCGQSLHPTSWQSRSSWCWGLVDWQAAKIREGENFTKKHQGEIHQEKIRVIDQRIMAQFKAPQTED